MSNSAWVGPFASSNPYRRNEEKIMSKLEEIISLFKEQGYTHPDQEKELKNGVHIIQNIIMHRICQRNFPKKFPEYTKINEK